MEINLKLTLDEVNGIIAVLSTLPFSQVAELMTKVRNQAIEQVHVSDEPVEAEKVEG